MTPILCTDATPQFLNYFDLSVAPALLYYSYVPVIIVAFILGIYVLIKDKYSSRSKFLFCISLSFILWVLNIILQWVVVHANVMMFLWQLTALIEIFIPISVLYFYYTFTSSNKIPISIRYFAYFVIVAVLIAVPTQYNMLSFSTSLCQAAVGPLLYILAGLEIFVAFWILISGMKQRRFLRNEPQKRNQPFILAIGSFLFLLIFSSSNLIGLVTQWYPINLYGPIGMLLFLAFLTYAIVRFKSFDIKLVGAQALVVSLIVLIGSQFFFIQTDTNRLLTAITLVITGAIGVNLIRSVKKEVALREQIQKQEQELEKANARLKELDQLKSEFVSLATHQIRGPLTAIKGYASLMIQGDLGVIPENIKATINTIYDSSNALAVIVQDFLDVSRIEQGRMKYDFSIFDFGKLAYDVVEELDPTITRKGLRVKLDIDRNLNVNGDIGKLRQVIENLIDNAIKYTPRGSILVTLKKVGELARLSVADSGVGIKPETLPRLFQKFSRAEDASKANILGTGLGLYVAKQLIEAQKGKIWAESAGEGKGSTFFVELPCLS